MANVAILKKKIDVNIDKQLYYIDKNTSEREISCLPFVLFIVADVPLFADLSGSMCPWNGGLDVFK